MTILEMINEWRRGCSDANNPVCCHQCTNGLIDAIERKLNTPDFNYPECLNSIVDAGMRAAEAKILEFKIMDEHDEMMARMNTPADNMVISGGGGDCSIYGFGGGGSSGCCFGGVNHPALNWEDAKKANEGL